MIRLPGLTDPHVHMREPGATHKEDWLSGTAAAVAGGFTRVLAMPNTQPPITDEGRFKAVIQKARQDAHCDFGQFAGAGSQNARHVSLFAPRSAGLKMYLDQTYGPLRLDSMVYWTEHFKHWPRDLPIVAHAEGRTMAAVILIAALYERSVHIAHISRREEILLVRKAKERGLQVTCEVTPHHLFLTEEDIAGLGSGRSEVRPRLASAHDRDALWENLSVIDCLATDHAPHTLAEKHGDDPPPGYPGLETALPLMLTAVAEGRLSMDRLAQMMHIDPGRIFRLPVQQQTWVEIDPGAAGEIKAGRMYSRCGWTPFEGWPVRGRVSRVVLRGVEVFSEGRVVGQPGFGKNVRDQRIGGVDQSPD